MNREDKAAAISELGEGIGKATNAFVMSFKGITVPQVTELRRQVRDTSSTYVVVKNTLALIAVKDSPLTALKGAFSGPTAVAYNTTDAVALAKALTKFAKDVPAITFKGAMLDGQIVAADQIQAIANLPSRNELISKLLYVLQSPMRGLATVLAANIRNLAVVIDQIAKQKAEGAAPAAAEASAPEASAPEASAPEAPAAEASVPEAPAPETTA
jgi:large subunit ribosomal protein L10